MSAKEENKSHSNDSKKTSNKKEMEKSVENKKSTASQEVLVSVGAANEDNKKLWLKISDYNLTVFDKKVLEAHNQWLTDNILNAAQFLLKKQFPRIRGLQNVLLNISQGFQPIERNQSFVQIVNEGGNHWVVLSNAKINNKINKCVIYDSNGLTQKFGINYSEEVKKAVLRLIRADIIDIEIAYVFQQPDQNQCGLYAIAFAHALCSGTDPTDICFSSSATLLRQHLIRCLTKRQIFSFPTGKNTVIDTFII